MFSIFKRYHKISVPSEKEIHTGIYGVAFKIGNVNCIGSLTTYKDLIEFEDELSKLTTSNLVFVQSYKQL
jgi:hypothetical protein